MKHLIRTFIVVFGLAAVLPACKKDAVDLENSYMDLLLDDEDGVVTAVHNEIRYVANLAPASLSDGKVTVTYTSEADPEGLSKELNYWNNELTYGRDVYNVQQLDYNFYVAAQTSAEENWLKVNPEGDKITITIGDNVFSETVDFKKKHDPLIVANITQGLSGGLGGDFYYYNETGDRPDIKIYSDTDSSPITASPDDQLGDNGYYASDLVSGHEFGYTIYPVSLITDPEADTNWTNEVDVNAESDVLYVEINGKTFSMPINGEDRYYQITMTPAK
jgi:hypothetical protein